MRLIDRCVLVAERLSDEPVIETLAIADSVKYAEAVERGNIFS